MVSFMYMIHVHVHVTALFLFHDFMIELPVFMDFEDHFFRVSVQAYNNRSDLERLIDALKELL